MTADLAVPASLDLLSSGGGWVRVGGGGGVLLLLPPGYVTAVIPGVFYLCASFTHDSFVLLPHLSLIEMCLQLSWAVAGPQPL